MQFIIARNALVVEGDKTKINLNSALKVRRETKSSLLLQKSYTY